MWVMARNKTYNLERVKSKSKSMSRPKSKGKGKSGGARVITNVKVVNAKVYLITVYDKSDKESMPLSELKAILKTISQD